MINNILVPTDFSEKAEYALKVAADLSRKYDAKLYVLHMLELPMHLATGESSSNLPEAIYFMKLAHKQFEEIMDKPYLEGIEVEEVVESHETYQGVIDAVAKYDVDLVVMGSAGASGLAEIFIGSNTEKVVRNSQVPVLVIKKDMGDFDVNRFVFASDFNEKCKKPFEKALDFANSFNAKIHLLYINTPNQFVSTHEAEAKIDNFLSGYDKDRFNVIIYNDDTVEHGIINFCNAITADCIGISTHGRKGLAHFFNGSLSEDLVNHATRPVLTLKI